MPLSDYSIFEQWYQENQRGFHCSHSSIEEIAYSAFLAGYELAKEEIDDEHGPQD